MIFLKHIASLQLYMHPNYILNLNYSRISNIPMNILLLVSTIFCIVLLAFIAYAFVNNSNLKLINQVANTSNRSGVDTSTDNDTANETENQ
jgi:peptidoglycan/LPS O-acetylase OafA/YrhL